MLNIVYPLSLFYIVFDIYTSSLDILFSPAIYSLKILRPYTGPL